jgi:pimeloyl-ACP methyl ester carboxylesterase
MIHGIASNLALWLNIQPVLAEDFKVTTYDLRGHGYSDMPLKGYTSADMADDLNGILDSLDIKQTHLVGHSFGGLVALHYTVLHPGRVIKLVLADTGVPAVETARKSMPVLEMWRDRLAKFGISVPDDKQDDVNYLITQTRKLRQQSAHSSEIKKRRMGGLPNIFETICPTANRSLSKMPDTFIHWDSSKCFSKISESSLALVITRAKQPGFNACAIARAFNIALKGKEK